MDNDESEEHWDLVEDMKHEQEEMENHDSCRDLLNRYIMDENAWILKMNAGYKAEHDEASIQPTIPLVASVEEVLHAWFVPNSDEGNRHMLVRATDEAGNSGELVLNVISFPATRMDQGSCEVEVYWQ